MAEIEGKMIIAMKGHPGTGKSTLASSIASLFKFPLLDKDDIKDCTSSLLSDSNLSLLNDLSYDAVFRLASTQLRLGLSVLIDFPLSRRSHLDRLIHLASSAGARLLIVECRPRDEAEWRRRLERRGSDCEASWHKPATWPEMEKLMEGYGGSTDFDVGDVPKLVVDTTALVTVEELVSSVVEFIASHSASVKVNRPSANYL